MRRNFTGDRRSRTFHKDCGPRCGTTCGGKVGPVGTSAPRLARGPVEESVRCSALGSGHTSAGTCAHGRIVQRWVRPGWRRRCLASRCTSEPESWTIPARAPGGSLWEARPGPATASQNPHDKPTSFSVMIDEELAWVQEPESGPGPAGGRTLPARWSQTKRTQEGPAICTHTQAECGCWDGQAYTVLTSFLPWAVGQWPRPLMD